MFWIFFENKEAAQLLVGDLGRGRVAHHLEDGWYVILQGISGVEADTAFDHGAVRILPVVPVNGLPAECFVIQTN